MITFIRHAKTDYNNKKLFQGRLDINLSENGIRETIQKSKGFPQNFDVCFCSPLKRTTQTAEILVPYLKPNFDNRIMERDFGDWEGTVITDDKLESLNNNEVPPNGENIYEIDKRVSDFLQMLNEKYNNKNVIVVTHSGIIHSVGRVLEKNIESTEHLELITVKN